MAANKKKRVAAGQRRPVEAIPANILFFVRTLNMLQGLASSLHCRVPFLGILTKYVLPQIVLTTLRSHRYSDGRGRRCKPTAVVAQRDV